MRPFLGRYQLVKKIAVGGMAELYLARMSGVGGFAKEVVVKRMLPQLAAEEDLQSMFLDEARIAATLAHPNVVQVYDAGESDGECYIAMEYLDGTDLRTLRKVLAEDELPLPWEHALFIASSVAAGLHYAHDKNDADGSPLHIIHRDVTPHNVFLTRDGGVKLVDFGIAKARNRQTETVQGTLKGKLAYMSPEQCVGDSVDRRSDIYSLGILLYELTTGRRLYRAQSDFDLMQEIVRGEIEAPSSFMEYPADLERILLRCLAKDPDDRYPTARAVQSALEGFARRYDLLFSPLALAEFLAPLLASAAAKAEQRQRERSAAAGTPPPMKRVVAASGNPRTGVVPESLGGFEDDPRTARLPADFVEQLREGERAAHAREMDKSAVPRRVHTIPSDRLRRPATGTGTPSVVAGADAAALGDIEIDFDEVAGEIDTGEGRGELELGATVVDDSAPVDASDATVVDDGAEAAARDAAVADDGARASVSDAADIDEPADGDGDGELDAWVDGGVGASTEADIEAGLGNTFQDLARSAPTGRAKRAAVSRDVGHTEITRGIDFENVRIKRRSGALWLVLAVLLGGAIATYFVLDRREAPARSAEPAAPERPASGVLSVDGADGATVWLFLGRAPIEAFVVHGAAEHRIRVEHDGYEPRELVLGRDTWRRSGDGQREAVAEVELVPSDVDVDGDAEPVDPAGAGRAPRRRDLPARLRVSSQPAAAGVWLYVGTTPGVRVGNLALSQRQELRIERDGQAPEFAVVDPDDFDDLGRAALVLDDPAR